MKKISVFVPYIAAAAIVTVITVLIYVVVQQNYRSGANDPQVQVAKDIHERLRRGASLQKYLDDSINIESNIGVFAALYNGKAEPVQSSGFLDGRFPQLPRGVFDFVKTNGEERVTWQPKPGVRMATVVLYAGLPSIAYIVVGRSLQEVEIREHRLVETVFVSWVIVMAFIAIAAMVQTFTRMKQNLVV